MHCPKAECVDDLQHLEGLGVADLQVAPWTPPGVLADTGVGTIMQQQQPLQMKLNAIRDYAETVIVKV